VRGRGDLFSGIKRIGWVKIWAEKYSACKLPKISINSPPSRLGSSEGRFANVTTREAGMRWTQMCLLTSGTDADGEMVWSWRPKGLALSWR